MLEWIDTWYGVKATSSNKGAPNYFEIYYIFAKKLKTANLRIIPDANLL